MIHFQDGIDISEHTYKTLFQYTTHFHMFGSQITEIEMPTAKNTDIDTFSRSVLLL